MIVSRFDQSDSVSTNTSALTMAEDDIANFDVREQLHREKTRSTDITKS